MWLSVANFITEVNTTSCIYSLPHTTPQVALNLKLKFSDCIKQKYEKAYQMKDIIHHIE